VASNEPIKPVSPTRFGRPHRTHLRFRQRLTSECATSARYGARLAQETNRRLQRSAITPIDSTEPPAGCGSDRLPRGTDRPAYAVRSVWPFGARGARRVCRIRAGKHHDRPFAARRPEVGGFRPQPVQQSRIAREARFTELAEQCRNWVVFWQYQNTDELMKLSERDTGILRASQFVAFRGVPDANRLLPTESNFGELLLDGLHVPDRNAAVRESHGNSVTIGAEGVVERLEQR